MPSLFSWFRRRQLTLPPISASDMATGFPVVVSGGRLRKAGIPYAMPADLSEINRLDFQHYLLGYVFQGLYAAPIGMPDSILDVGTGTARWAYEMANLFPASSVVAVDVTPPATDPSTDPRAVSVPPQNYRFVAANVLEQLPFPDASFAFVHMRLLYSAIPHARWPSVIAELARVTKPGGWIESIESAVALQPGPVLAQISETINTLIERRGIIPTDGMHVGDLMRSAGLDRVETRRIEVPLGSYGGRIGSMMATDLLAGIEGFSGLLIQLGLTSNEQFQQTHAALKAELAAPNNRARAPFYIAYGRRQR